VPFLSREREAVHGQGVVLEALQALYNICKFNKRVHLEVAATGGIVPHLCRCAWLRAAPAAVPQLPCVCVWEEGGLTVRPHSCCMRPQVCV
jgi:hypothetical protein